MRHTIIFALVAALVVAGYFAFFNGGPSEAGKKGEPMLSHDVYFALKDNSPRARDELVAACKKYLSKHPGEVFFAVGTLNEELKREVNDRDFDVALHIVFKDKASQDKYQTAERHEQFIAENKANWKKVRVFDSLV
jgi:hypothetical protein